MNRADRQNAIVEELRSAAPRPRTAGWLARRFQVSVRTVERDVRALRRTGLTVRPQPGPTGGYVVDVTRSLPPVSLTAAEAVAVSVGLRQLKHTPLTAPAGTALRKVEEVMPEPARSLTRQAEPLRLLAPPSEPDTASLVIQEALVERRVLRMGYADRHGTVTTRLVEPLGFLAGEHWCLVGWCRLRSAVRGFRLDRVRHASALDERAPRRTLNLDGVDALGRQLTVLDTADEAAVHHAASA